MESINLKKEWIIIGYVKDVLELFNLKIPALSAVTLAMGSVLFLPTTILTQLKLGDLRDEWGQIIGLIFLVTGSVLVINILCLPFEAYKGDRFRRNKHIYFENMDGRMAGIIHELLVNPDNTVILPINNGLVAELQSNVVISPVNNSFLVDGMNPQIPFLLQPWASKMIMSDANLREKFCVS